MNDKILICDDARFMRVTLKNSLEKEGYQVVDEAENGEVLIEKYKQLNPDLILMDITMPVMDGISALSSIMEINPNAKGDYMFCDGTRRYRYQSDKNWSQRFHC